MRAVVLKVTCSVEILTKRKVAAPEVKAAVKEAVEEALHYAEGRGFNHSLSDDAAIVVTSVSV